MTQVYHLFTCVRHSPPRVEHFRQSTKAVRVLLFHFEKGKAIIAEWCSSRDLDTRFSLLRRAQAFTVSLFPHGLQGLQRMGAIREVQLGSGILYLDEKFYSNKFGISVESTEQMEDLIA